MSVLFIKHTKQDILAFFPIARWISVLFIKHTKQDILAFFPIARWISVLFNKHTKQDTHTNDKTAHSSDQGFVYSCFDVL